MKKLFNMMFIAAAGLFMVACGDDVTDTSAGDGGPVTLTAPAISNITSSSASVTATATGGGIFRKGICYATHQNPSISDTDVRGIEKGAMTMTVNGLKASTVYYVRTYAMTEGQTHYSDEVTFTTAAKSSTDALDEWKAPTYQDDYRNIS
jgi:hypothetical protein